MAKDKIRPKSTLSFGNLPIYADTGAHTDAGCLFVINTRILYEFGRVQMKFIQQTEPNLINQSSVYPAELELDIANLIKLKTALRLRQEINITKESRKFLLVGSSTMKDYAVYQKPGYVRFEEEKIVFNLMHNSSQALFEINGLFQVELFIDYIDRILDTIITGTQSFDFYKNHGIGSLLSSPEAMPNQIPVPT